MLEAVARSDIIFTCVADDKAVLAVFETLSASYTTAKLVRITKDKKAPFVACPVFGAPAMADAGQLVCVLAGRAEDVELVNPYTAGVMGRADIDLSGQAPSKATLLKVIGNTFVLSMIEALSEGHVVAEKSGLGVETLQKFVQALFPGPYTAYSERLRSGDYHKREEPLFSVDLARKDAKHALDIAKAAGARMKGVEVADGHLADAQKHVGSKGDIAGIYGAVRLESGLPYEN
ncbi:MAG: hypothetical protein M1832_002148 [Thelocarpon impressellum]|nr:MAG: hypothetical protein M1832_002148 [Thelocarpon impressellum]